MPIELFIAVAIVIGLPLSVFVYAVFVGYDERQPYENEEDWGSQDYQGRK